MARRLKGTRLRGLPPAVALAERENASGSFPTVRRTSSDNRTGQYNIFFDDKKTQQFGVKSDNVFYPLALTTPYLSNSLTPAAMLDLVSTKSITTSGALARNVSDSFISFNSPGQSLQPWFDIANPEMEAKLLVSSAFWLTGSTVEVAGQGFQQPLWSKTKVEIDITPAAVHSMSMLQSASNGSYPMCYWNPTTKMYEGIGTGKGIEASYPNSLTGLTSFLQEQVIAIGGSTDSGFISATATNAALLGRQISNFGFPYHAKFQPTSSQQISMENYLSEPFLVEKIVILLSGALDTNLYDSFLFCSTAIWTFTLTNTRTTVSGRPTKPMSGTFYNGSATAYVTSSQTTSTYMDVVDHAQINWETQVAEAAPYLNRELTLTPTLSATNSYFVGQMTISSSVKSSVEFSGALTMMSGVTNDPSDPRYVESLLSSGRNQLIDSNGRDWRNTFEKPSPIATTDVDGFGITTTIPSAFTKVNPYILLPTDKLTIGWHNPHPKLGGSLLGDPYYSLIRFFPTGVNKVILYGSSLRYNEETGQLEEHHDTLNQLLTSEAIHEVIG